MCVQIKLRCQVLLFELSLYHQEQEDTYNFLLVVYEKVLEVLKDGARLSSVYAAAMEHIEQNKPELLEHFTKTAGYVKF